MLWVMCGGPTPILLSCSPEPTTPAFLYNIESHDYYTCYTSRAGGHYLAELPIANVQ
jgi:hypothetical protein